MDQAIIRVKAIPQREVQIVQVNLILLHPDQVVNLIQVHLQVEVPVALKAIHQEVAHEVPVAQKVLDQAVEVAVVEVAGAKDNEKTYSYSIVCFYDYII